jgi:uracil-DNA glycosylase family 4
MNTLLSEIKRCTLCEPHLELGANPVMAAHPNSKIVIIGQAPGTKVHKTGIPWNDPSGDTLRKWLNLDKGAFYNIENIAILPMSFCYPGKGTSGDLPPRKECAIKWHEAVLSKMPNVELILLIGTYAQQYYLGKKALRNLTETVKNYEAYLPRFLPLPHPSPRNRFWLKKNPWFESEILPELKRIISQNL